MSLWRVSRSSCSSGSPRTVEKTGMSLGVRPRIMGFSCWSDMLVLVEEWEFGRAYKGQ